MSNTRAKKERQRAASQRHRSESQSQGSETTIEEQTVGSTAFGQRIADQSADDSVDTVDATLATGKNVGPKTVTSKASSSKAASTKDDSVKDAMKRARKNARSSREERALAKIQRQEKLKELWSTHADAGTKPSLSERWRVSKSQTWRKNVYRLVSLVSWFVYCLLAYTVTQVLALTVFPVIGGSVARLTGAFMINDPEYNISSYALPLVFLTFVLAFVLCGALLLVFLWVRRMLADFKNDLQLKTARVH